MSRPGDRVGVSLPARDIFDSIFTSWLVIAGWMPSSTPRINAAVQLVEAGVSVAEASVVFTVKLPAALAERVRAAAVVELMTPARSRSGDQVVEDLDHPVEGVGVPRLGLQLSQVFSSQP